MPRVRQFVLPLNNPDVVPPHEADHMLPDDIVVGLVVGSHAPWLTYRTVLGEFSREQAKARRAYRQFVQAGVEPSTR